MAEMKRPATKKPDVRKAGAKAATAQEDGIRSGRTRAAATVKEGRQTEKAISATVRTIAVLEALAKGGYASLETLAKRADLSKPTLFRFLKTLKNLGYVVQHDDTKYSLSLKMFHIGASALSSIDLYEAARPVILRLAKHFGETVHVAVMMDEMVVYVMKVESKHTIRMYSNIGKRAPLYCTSLGKAMLAWTADADTIVERLELVPYTERTIVAKAALLRELDSTRGRGYSIDSEEHEEKIHCIGAPIFDYSGNVVAAVSVSWPVFRFEARMEGDWAKAVMDAAAEISSVLGYAVGEDGRKVPICPKIA
jgi:IclR family KDG regulon transcriptional repressor